MKITVDKLKKMDACSESIEWLPTQTETDDIKLCEIAIEQKHADWVGWYCAHVLSRKGKIKFAIFAAEQVLDIYEKKYPGDKQPRKAIEAARKVLEADTEKNRAAAEAAAWAARDAAWAAAGAAWAARDAAEAAARDAAWAAAGAAWAARDAAEAAAEAAARDAAGAAAWAARDAMHKKIALHGLELLKEERTQCQR